MRIHRKRVLICLLLAICILFSGCAEFPQSKETEGTSVPSLPSDITEPIKAQESVPTLDANILQQSAGEEGLWVEFYQNGSLHRRFCLFSASHLYWEDDLVYADHPQTLPPQYIRFVRDDGTSELSVYPGSPDYVCRIQNGEETWFSAKLQEDSDYSLFSLLKQDLSGYLRNSYGRLSFSCDGSAEQVMEAYAETAYPEYAELINQLTKYGFTDYEALNWELIESHAKLIVGHVTYAVRYEHPELAVGMIIDGGTETPGTGEYEGWHLIERQVILEKHEDNLWHEVDNNDYLTATTSVDSPTQSAPETVADAEEFLTTVVQQAQALGTGVEDLAELTGLFLRTAHAVAVTGNDAFDWSWICTEDAVENVGMQSLLNYPYIFNGSYQPNFIFIENELALVYHYEAIVYYRFIGGKWFVEDVVRPFVIP